MVLTSMTQTLVVQNFRVPDYKAHTFGGQTFVTLYFWTQTSGMLIFGTLIFKTQSFNAQIYKTHFFGFQTLKKQKVTRISSLMEDTLKVPSLIARVS